MISTPAPTDQRAGVRPIAFLLDDAGSLSDPVFLKIRPEDLTRPEPSRVAVHQTLGRGVVGWIDNFGPGLPSVNISGHTGWRYGPVSGLDGAGAFEVLNDLVHHRYHAAKQAAIDRGMDPGLVKLLFVDTLDNFAWSVTPTQFVLRRSRSRPLLFQYNIALQAISTEVDVALVIPPVQGNPALGLESLAGQVKFLTGNKQQITSWVDQALSFVDGALGPVTAAIGGFVDSANAVFSAVQSVVGGVNALASGVAGRLIGIATQMASVGANIFRTINGIANLPGSLKAKIASVAAAYNEVLCIFSNALKPKKVYEEYSGLYGASNCSSTTEGRPASGLLDVNAFEKMVPEKQIISVSGGAKAALDTVSKSDPVLSPLPMEEIGRLSSEISEGVLL